MLVVDCILLLLYLLFACLLYFTYLYIVRNDENKDVQSMFNQCNRHEIKFILSCRHAISFHFPTNRMAIWCRPPDDLSRTFFVQWL